MFFLKQFPYFSLMFRLFFFNVFPKYVFLKRMFPKKRPSNVLKIVLKFSLKCFLLKMFP